MRDLSLSQPSFGAGDASAEGRPVPRTEVAAKLRQIIPRKPQANPAMEEKLASRTVDVLTNYFPMQTSSPMVYQYVVAFEPTLDSRTMRYSMLAAHSAVLGPRRSRRGWGNRRARGSPRVSRIPLSRSFFACGVSRRDLRL